MDHILVAKLNVLSLAVSSVAFYIYYLKSVRPAALEQTMIGPAGDAYERCAGYRLQSGVYMTVASINYLLYYFFPLGNGDDDDDDGVLPLWLPRQFPWSHGVSLLLAGCIGIPCGYLLWRGMKDAGEETMTPKREHNTTLYGGIYQYIRHPQGVGEMPLWWVMALACHSPFLTCWSCLYVPVWIHMCLAEEEDLVLRHGAPYQAYRKEVGAFFPSSSALSHLLWREAAPSPKKEL
jgi:protein-S-isoprenylcysteine O-methyltransferase Ste14